MTDKKKRILLFGVMASALADILLIPIMIGDGRKIDTVGIGLIIFLNAFLVGLAALPYFLKLGLCQPTEIEVTNLKPAFSSAYVLVVREKLFLCRESGTWHKHAGLVGAGIVPFFPRRL